MADDNLVKKIFLVIIYLIIILLIPIFLDLLLKISVRKNREKQLYMMALENAKKKAQSLVVFTDRYNGFIINDVQLDKAEKFNGDIINIVDNMIDNSCIVMVSLTLEYIDNDELKRVIQNLMRISGGNLYILAIEKTSPRLFWDYKIKNIFDKSFYIPNGQKISWTFPNNLQTTTQKFYSYLFKILPYSFFMKSSLPDKN